MPTPSPNKRVPKSKFTPLEDQLLKQLVGSSETPNWSQIALCMRTKNARQCRERWQNYLNPRIREVSWTAQEDKTLIEKYYIAGPKWSLIAKYFVGKSANTVRNRFLQLVRNQSRSSALFEGIIQQQYSIQASIIEKLQYGQQTLNNNLPKYDNPLNQGMVSIESAPHIEPSSTNLNDIETFQFMEDFNDFYDIPADFLD